MPTKDDGLQGVKKIYDLRFKAEKGRVEEIDQIRYLEKLFVIKTTATNNLPSNFFRIFVKMSVVNVE